MRRMGRITLLGGLLLAAFVLVALRLGGCCTSSPSTRKQMSDAKNWIILAGAAIGLFAMAKQFSKQRSVGGPVRFGVSGIALIVLAYTALEEMRAVSPASMYGSYDVITVQMLALLLFLAPMFVRAFGVRMPDISPAGMVTRTRS